MNKRVVIISLVLVAIFGVVIPVSYLVPRNMFVMGLVEHMAPGLIPAGSLARNLESGDSDLIRESLAHLTDRRNSIAVTRAVQLLQSADDYIWLNAAHYVGSCGRQEAVPYLIKALRHTAWRADNETAGYLRSLTGQDFGIDFARWRTWWLGQHPDNELDWTSHLGFSPRLSLTSETKRGGQQDGAANRSQPIRSETNRTSSAAGSDR